MNTRYSIGLLFFLLFSEFTLCAYASQPYHDVALDSCLFELIRAESGATPAGAFSLLAEGIKQSDAELSSFSQGKEIITILASSLGLTSYASPYEVMQVFTKLLFDEPSPLHVLYVYRSLLVALSQESVTENLKELVNRVVLAVIDANKPLLDKEQLAKIKRYLYIGGGAVVVIGVLTIIGLLQLHYYQEAKELQKETGEMLDNVDHIYKGMSHIQEELTARQKREEVFRLQYAEDIEDILNNQKSLNDNICQVEATQVGLSTRVDTNHAKLVKGLREDYGVIKGIFRDVGRLLDQQGECLSAISKKIKG